MIFTRALCAIPLAALVVFALPEGRAAQPPKDAPKNDDALAKLAKTYKIEIVTTAPTFPVQTAHGKIEGKAAGKKDVENYSGLFVAEFGLYPPDLIKRSKLKRVVLCDELSFAGQRRNAIPDYENDTLYLDVVRGKENKTYVRKVIHHEFFHIIDYRDDGQVYEDERWAKLNPADFKYDRGGGTGAQGTADTSVLTDKYPGFLNHYSTTGAEEDKAEVFANLIVDGAYVADRAKKDKVLAAKVERMKELLAKFCPEMSDKFWAKVDKIKRDDKK